MQTPATRLTKLVGSLVSCSGREPAGFQVCLAGGRIEIRNTWATAAYAMEAWTSKFTRDLHGGRFDEGGVHGTTAEEVELLSCGTG